ncbi:spore coat protein [Bacillus paralicheniformis]|uniref:spore coat protein n=1 Tax=Bacillus paralicheniformis TaxID=1648923 RepID=UPI003D1A7885
MSFHEKAEALYAETFDELSREYDQLIEVIDSEHVTVNTTNITAALSLQAIVITLIILLLQLAIEDEDAADIVSEQILAVQRLQSRRKIIIKAINSCNVTITLSSEDILLSVQLLTDVLIALMIVLDIL